METEVTAQDWWSKFSTPEQRRKLCRFRRWDEHLALQDAPPVAVVDGWEHFIYSVEFKAAENLWVARNPSGQVAAAVFGPNAPLRDAPHEAYGLDWEPLWEKSLLKNPPCEPHYRYESEWSAIAHMLSYGKE